MGANIRYAYAERKRNLHGTPAVKPYIKHRMPDLQRQALALVPVNRRAVRASINRTLQLGREAVYAQMRQVFRAPVPYTLNAVRVEQARTNGELAGAVMVKGPEDTSGTGIPAQSYLRAQILGGARRWKRFEVALLKRGLLPRGWYCVPGRAARLDQWGNMSRGQLVQLLSYFQAFPASGGYRSNMSDKRRSRLGKGTRSRFGVRYFVQQPGQAGLKPGIWEVQANNSARLQGAPAPTRMVVAFVPRATYRRRLDFFGTLERTASQQMPRAHGRALDAMPLESLLPDVRVPP